MKALSESATLEQIGQHLTAAMDRVRRGQTGWVAEHIVAAQKLVFALYNQARHGVHRNPPLTVFANPGRRAPFTVHPSPSALERGGKRAMTSLWVAGQIAESLHLIRYTHVEDGEDYEHDFELDGTRAYAVGGAGLHRSVLLTGDADIWDDY